MGPVDESVAIATVRHAIDSGITLVDTAQGYFDSEAIVGKALRDGYRRRCFLTTKVTGDYTPEGITRAAEASLRNLGTDTIDLYLIHKWDPAVPVADSMAALVRLQEQGKVREIGVSNFTDVQMARALAAAPFAANQYGYSLFDREIEEDVLPFCEERGIGVVAHSCLGKGILAGRHRMGHRFGADDERSRMPQFQGEILSGYLRTAARLQDIATDLGLDLIRLSLAWLLRHSAVSTVLVGAKSPEQVDAFLKAESVRLPEDAVARIETIVADAPTTWSRE